MATETSDTTGAATELRGLTDDELVLRLREAKEELFNLRFQSATGQLDNNRRLHVVRRDIARIYTVMRERELGIYPAGEPARPEPASTGSTS
ncbi:MAG: 50S ribosomal protein L29 [Frankiaceae bacterium]|jgi:large subunit ribosomal protein L29